MENKVQERVARGAAYLDRRMPGWADKVDIRTLRMADGTYCVLGQLHGEYSNGIFALLMVEKEEHGYYQTGYKYGFDVSPHAYGTTARDQYRKLKQLWIKEIEARRAPVVPIKTEEAAVVTIKTSLPEREKVGA